MKSIQKALNGEELREVFDWVWVSSAWTRPTMLYRAILVHVLDLLMNVANQPKALKKDTQHFKRQSWWDILYQQLKKNPFEYLMWKLFVVMLH